MAEGEAIALAAVAPVALTLPPDSRDGVPPPTAVFVQGPFRYIGATRKGMRKYVAPLPIRPRGLFFHRAEPGMRLERAGRNVRYTRFGRHDEPTWFHDRDSLTVFLPVGAEPPKAGEYALIYPRARAREKALNLRFSQHADAPEAFVRTPVQDGWDARRGLLLPAPAEAAYAITLPPAAELVFDGGIVLPETADGSRSDGATLHVEVDEGGTVTSVATFPLAPGEFVPRRVDLSAWGGRDVTLQLRTDPGATSRFDYAFLGDPVVSSRKRDPRRVVLVFLDTTRPDHLSLYGYERDTSAKLDDLRKTAAVFGNARTVSPWTLPSAQAVMIGGQPDYYPLSPTLPQILGREGFATAMIAGNVYLSPNFGMDRGWGLHRVSLWPLAETVVDDAIAWLDAHDGQDVLLQVQFMEAHLPYAEPDAYRRLYAGDGPASLRDQFHLADVRKADVTAPDDRQYVVDRYDNNIRYMTDQVARLRAHLDDDDVLVIYGDHGEEFWEHDGFEHGHTLYDELLKVPLVIDGPGISGGRVAAPVSLVDIAPTVLDLVGVPIPDTMEGESLAPVARREPGSADALTARPQGFGRTLYGMERWGALVGDHKWSTTEGREALYDLKADPGEHDNLAPGRATGPYVEALGEALSLDVAVAYRLVNLEGRKPSREPTVAVLRVPGGVAEAFVGADPLDNSSAELVVDDAVETVTVTWPPGQSSSREVYVVPNLALDEVTHGLALTVTSGEHARELTVPESRPAGLARNRRPLMVARLGKERAVQLTWAITPLPDEDAMLLSGTDAELGGALQAMGYTEH